MGKAGHIRLKTNVTLTLKDPEGNVVEERSANDFTPLGLNIVADLLTLSPAYTGPTHIAIGEGTPEALNLETEIDRVAVTSARVGNVTTYSAQWAPGEGTGTLTEVGLFNDDTSGDMICFSDFAAINKAAGSTLDVDWEITVE